MHRVRVRVRVTARSLCVPTPICHSRELFMHRVRVRVTARSLCVPTPICHSRELFKHRVKVRVRVTARSLCVLTPICHSRELFMHGVWGRVRDRARSLLQHIQHCAYRHRHLTVILHIGPYQPSSVFPKLLSSGPFYSLLDVVTYSDPPKYLHL